MTYGTVFCCGDSLTFGARDPWGGFPERLPPLMRARDGAADTEWSAVTEAVCGDTTLDLLRRMPAIVGRMRGTPGPKYATVLIGTNDCKAGAADHGVIAAIDDWKRLYRQILGWIRRVDGVALVLATLPPFDDAAMPCFRGGQQFRCCINHQTRKIAEELDGHPAPIVLVELGDMPEEHLIDGVHLRPSGNAYLAEQFAAAMRAGS